MGRAFGAFDPRLRGTNNRRSGAIAENIVPASAIANTIH
jgi:hypothetical protein